MKVHVWITKRKCKRGYSYAVQWQDPRTGQRRTESCGGDKAYARQKAAERHKELLTGQYRGITSISYDSFVTEHLGQLRGTLSEASYVEHERTLRQLKEACSLKNMTAIDYQMLEKYRSTRVSAGVSPATVNKSLRTLQSILEKAVKRGYLNDNPFKGNRKALFVTEPEPAPTTVDADNYQRLLDACPDNRWRAIVTIGFYTGMRRGEILSLEWSDIDFENKLLRVYNKDDHATKSRKIRTVPMTTQVSMALSKLQLGMLKNSLVFVNKGGRKMTNNFDRHYRRIAWQAGLVDSKGNLLFTMKGFRSNCATELQRRGVPMKTAQRILGHSNMSTTAKYYTGVEDRDLRDAIKRLEANSA